jgi:hypothetical protein
LKNENQFCLEVQCPKHIEQSTFENEFEDVLKIIFGFPLWLKKENIEILLSISSQLENSNIFNSCIEFLSKNDLSNIDTILFILSNSELLSETFDIHSIISKFSEDFENISFESLSKIPPSGISKILQSPNLKLKSEDSLFEFLLKYSKKWNELSIPLFSNVYFEYLNTENLSKFFEIISKSNSNFDLPHSVIESLSFVFKDQNRFVHKTRHLSQNPINSINPIPSLSSLRIENEELQKENSKLKSEKSRIENESVESTVSLNKTINELKTQISSLNVEDSNSNDKSKPTSKSKSDSQNGIEFPPSPKDHNGLFHFLRQQCDFQNPHLSGLIKVSASHFYNENQREWNILDWGTSKFWYSGDQNEGTEIWIDFDLLGRSFILNGMSIYIQGDYMPKCWSLLGSDGSDNFEPIYESNNCLTTCSQIVLIQIM